MALKGSPAGVAWSGDGARLFVAEQGAATVAEIDLAAGPRVLRRFGVGPYPAGLALAPKRKLLLVTNSGLGSVSVVDLESGTEKNRLAVGPSPVAIAVTPDETLAVVANLLPAGDATDVKHSSTVSLIDLETLKRVADIRMPGGSALLRDVAVSPDGKWAYAVHTVGRFTLPTTQLERGWVNTNAMSIIDLGEKKRYVTVLLDHISEGGADPWGLAVAPDGKTLWVSLAGVHQVARVDLAKLHGLLAGQIAGPLKKQLDELNRYRNAGVQVTWLDIQADPAKRELLVNDLTAMHIAEALRRTPVPGRLPAGGGPLARRETVGRRVLLQRP